MTRKDLISPALAVLCALAAGACDNPKVQEQTRQAGEAIKTAGKETGEAVKAAGQQAVEETKAAVEQAGQEVTASAQKAGKDLADAAEKAGDSAKKELEKAGATAKKKIADASVTASIKAKLIANKDVKAVSIDVDTVAGRVTLRGTAQTTAQKDEAGRIAHETEGVVSVDNQIVVSPG